MPCVSPADIWFARLYPAVFSQRRFSPAKITRSTQILTDPVKLRSGIRYASDHNHATIKWSAPPAGSILSHGGRVARIGALCRAKAQRPRLILPHVWLRLSDNRAERNAIRQRSSYRLTTATREAPAPRCPEGGPRITNWTEFCVQWVWPSTILARGRDRRCRVA
jgi:hypothetical protein